MAIFILSLITTYQIAQNDSFVYFDDLFIGSNSLIYFKGDSSLFTGKAIFDYENGIRHFEVTYVNGCTSGEWKEYYDNGFPKAQGDYKCHSIEVEHYFEWYQSGEIKLSGFFSDGQKDKGWFFYNESGKVVQEDKYEMGKLINSINFE